ncbi:MAG: radical SAM protein [Chromatiaceae bacterium]|nr:radical SAM protein [Chromatiaceae bacterium]
MPPAIAAIPVETIQRRRAPNAEHRVGEAHAILSADGLTVLFRVADRPMLFDGARGRFVGALDADLTGILERIADNGGWSPRLRAASHPEGAAVHPLDDLARLWLERPLPDPDRALPTLMPTHFIVFPAAACNMACDYCCNDQGQFGGTHHAGSLSLPVAERFLDWLHTNPWGDAEGDIELLLIGGEPTLNSDVCRYFVQGAIELNQSSERRFKVKISTNGLKVPKDLIDTAAHHPDVVRFGVSIDGSRERHDAHRVDHHGRGTFERIVGFLRTLQQRGIRYNVTAVLPYPYEFSAVYRELRALGAEQIEIKAADVTPFNAADTIQGEHDFATWRAAYLAYNQLQIDEMHGGFRGTLDRRYLMSEVFSPFGSDAYSCDAGIKQVALSPDGHLYPCDRFFGQPEYRIGSLNEAGNHAADDGIDRDALHRYHQHLAEHGRMASEHPDCKTCFAREICRGGCYGNNLARDGRIDAIAAHGCDRRREKLRIDLYFLARLAEELPERFAELGGRHA